MEEVSKSNIQVLFFLVVTLHVSHWNIIFIIIHVMSKKFTLVH